MTREWIRKAEDDFRVAEILAAGRERFHDPVCFHSGKVRQTCRNLLGLKPPPRRRKRS